MAESGIPGWEAVAAYFGEPWSSEVCERGRRAETPTGALCWLCGEIVMFGHRGTWIAQWSGVERRKVSVPVHRECLMRQLAGSLAHLEQRCECFGGTDGPVGSFRQEALRVWAWLEEHRFQLPTIAGRVH